MLTKSIFIMLLLFYNIILFPVITKSRIWSSYYFNRFDSSSLKTLSVYLCQYFHVRISFASDVSRLLSASRNAVQVSIWDMTVSSRNKDVVSLRLCERSMYYLEQITSIPSAIYYLISTTLYKASREKRICLSQTKHERLSIYFTWNYSNFQKCIMVSCIRFLRNINQFNEIN